MRFDLATLPAERHPWRARLRLRCASASRPRWIGISSVAAPWVEGRGSGPARAGGASFLEAETGRRSWNGAGSCFLDIVFGAGGSAWQAAFVRHEPGGWISVPVPPWLVRAMREGSSDGLALSDEKGQTRENHDVAAREWEEPARLVLEDLRAEAPPLPPALRAQRAAHTPIAPLELPALAPWPEREPLRMAFSGAELRVLPLLRSAHAFDDAQGGPELERVLSPTGELVAALLHVHAGGAARVALRLPPLAEAVELACSGELGAQALLALPLEGATPPLLDPLLPLGALPLVLPPSQAARVLVLSFPIAAHLASRTLEVALILRGRDEEARVPLRVHVGRHALPRALRFHLSLNTYGRPHEDPELELAFHRLAHELRATLAVVPYSQGGRVPEGLAPRVVEEGRSLRLDFAAFAQRYGAYFDGRAFAACARAGAPIDHWIAPFHEGWPLPLAPSYAWSGPLERHAAEAPPIESALSGEYAIAWRKALRDWYDELARRGWLATRFQVFLNNKVDFRKSGSGTSWWLLDEPAYRDDFLALRWFADQHRAALPAEARSSLPFRVDLSRPQFRREHLDGAIDLAVNNAARWWPEPSLRPVREGIEQLWSYGEAPAPSEPLVRCAAWIYETFASGADGLVPWQSVGAVEHWREPSPLALLLPPHPTRGGGPAPTLRLLALSTAVEDVELALDWIESLPARERWACRERFAHAAARALGLRAPGRLEAAEKSRDLLQGAEVGAFLALRRSLVTEPARWLGGDEAIESPQGK
ncbi:MAG: hypothetical protein IPN34_07260 [Planctomycetes bacterium]|nr:hypothetical protein [Planctomycetota bacterium]